MAHVFISYSSKHRDLTEQLAGFLESRGLDVWWDKKLVSLGPFDPQIRRELDKASCVVVLWTQGAIHSDYVKFEADVAYANGSAKSKLVSVTAEGVDWNDLPAPYNTFEHHRPYEMDLILRDILAVQEGRLLLDDKLEDWSAAEARTPTMLLQAKFGLVPFTGNDNIRDDIIDWAMNTSAYTRNMRRAAGRLIHGPGGIGKTRLLIEVAEKLRAKGWSAGFLTLPDPAAHLEQQERRIKALEDLIEGATDKGLLLVLDYAESRSEEIARLAKAIQSPNVQALRPIQSSNASTSS